MNRHYPNGKPRVVITDFIDDDLAPERGVLEGVATVESLNAGAESDLAGRIEDADAIMQYHTISLTAMTLRRLAHCKLLVRCGAGFDNVNHVLAAELGIPVANVPDYGTEEVADSAIGLMLSLTRGIALLNSRLRRGQEPWSYLQAVPLERLRGQCLGVVGLGRIGTATALRAKAFGMDVVYYDPFKADGYDKALGVRRAWTLDELLSTCHVVSLHCPLTKRTNQLLNRETIARMRRSSYVINTARGGLVDPNALLEAIESGHLAGAGIDVLEREPPSPQESLIRAWRDPSHPAHDRVVLNPHAAFYSEQGLLDMRRKGAMACRRALLGDELSNLVNGDMLSRAVKPPLEALPGRG